MWHMFKCFFMFYLHTLVSVSFVCNGVCTPTCTHGDHSAYRLPPIEPTLIQTVEPID